MQNPNTYYEEKAIRDQQKLINTRFIKTTGQSPNNLNNNNNKNKNNEYNSMFGIFKLEQPATTNSIPSISPSEPSRIVSKYISSIPKYIKTSNKNEINTISSTITDVYNKPVIPSSSSLSTSTDYMEENNIERKRNIEVGKEKEKTDTRLQQIIEDDDETKINELYRQFGLPSKYIDNESETEKIGTESQQNMEDDDETKINNLYKKFGILSTYNDTEKKIIDMEDSDDSGDNYIDEEFEKNDHKYDEKDDNGNEDTNMNDNSKKNEKNNEDEDDDKGKKRIIRIQRKKHPLDAKHHIYNNARKMDRQYEITVEKELDQLLDAILPVKKKIANIRPSAKRKQIEIYDDTLYCLDYQKKKSKKVLDSIQNECQHFRNQQLELIQQLGSLKAKLEHVEKSNKRMLHSMEDGYYKNLFTKKWNMIQRAHPMKQIPFE
ncbi:hypothetical protein BJ944DRAFT_21276 [Cunninghamella echinulata]|nr:hypothetical protein BJ944DRAFT_21276 [Cunninghamella echinulata]